MKTLTFVNYFDVWGNEQDGFEVNDVTRHKISGQIPECNQDLIELLRDNGIVHKHVGIGDFGRVEFDEFGVELTEMNGRPFGRIEWEV